MTDMYKQEQCISNLEQQIGWIEDIKTHQFPGWGHTVNAMRHAIALLKAQEPMECEDTNKARIFCCSVCGYKVEDIFIDERKFEYPSINFCPNCGRVVKWE